MVKAAIPKFNCRLDDRVFHYRTQVARDWARSMRPLARHDARIPARLPGYFSDRFAFMAAHRGASSVKYEEAPGFDAESILGSYLETVRATLRPTHSLNGWTAELHLQADLTDFYETLLRRWNEFAVGLSLPSALTRLESRGRLTWHDIFTRSIFFPRPPVISGPNFFDRLDNSDRKAARRRFGENAPIDFFCFMQHVHETVHAEQTGEPLLNEVVQAALWVTFLNDASDLWCLQRNSATGRGCIAEAFVVDAHPTLVQWAVRAGLDAYRLVTANAAPGAYNLLCLWAHAMDRRRIRYREYLEGVRMALSRMTDVAWVWSTTKILSQEVDKGTPLSASDLSGLGAGA